MRIKHAVHRRGPCDGGGLGYIERVGQLLGFLIFFGLIIGVIVMAVVVLFARAVQFMAGADRMPIGDDGMPYPAEARPAREKASH